MVRPLSDETSMSTRLISWMLLSLNRGAPAVVAVGFVSHRRYPRVARDIQRTEEGAWPARGIASAEADAPMKLIISNERPIFCRSVRIRCAGPTVIRGIPTVPSGHIRSPIRSVDVNSTISGNSVSQVPVGIIPPSVKEKPHLALEPSTAVHSNDVSIAG